MPSLYSRDRASESVARTPVRQTPATETIDLPPYEAPIAPLNDAAQSALDLLLQTHSSRKLKANLEAAATSISEIAGSLNEAGGEARKEYARRLARLEANGQEASKDDTVKLETLTGRIGADTKRLDMTMREIVDNNYFVESLPEILGDVRSKTQEISTQITTTTLTHTQPRNRRRDAHAEVEGAETASDENADGHPGLDEEQTLHPPAPSPESAPSAIYKSSLASHIDAWNSKSLTSRYTTSNHYVGFYRIVHDAKHVDDTAPPVPHASAWFGGEENPDASLLEEPASEDEELEIAAERTSTRCPITMLPFRNPVTSTKCPHSFERSAIINMMHKPTKSRSQKSQGHTQQEKEVACPVCGLRLTEKDLRPDPALLRKVKRIEAVEKRAQEENSDEDDDDDEPRGTQRRAALIGSSPASASKIMARRVKEERMSGLSRAVSSQPTDSRQDEDHDNEADIDRVPGTQMTTGGAIMVDLGEEEEEEDEE